MVASISDFYYNLFQSLIYVEIAIVKNVKTPAGMMTTMVILVGVASVMLGRIVHGNSLGLI